MKDRLDVVRRAVRAACVGYLGFTLSGGNAVGLMVAAGGIA
jgi:hypothetical protein